MSRDAFIMRRGGGGAKKITFSDMPVVATRTLTNAITARTDIGCAADDEYFVVAGGKNASGQLVTTGTAFDRGGNKWTFVHPAVSEPGLLLTHGWLCTFGGANSNDNATTTSTVLSFGRALHNTGELVTLTTLGEGRFAPGIAKVGNDILVIGGMTGMLSSPGASRIVDIYSLYDTNGRPGTFIKSSNSYLPSYLAYCGLSNITPNSVLAAGGIDSSYTAKKNTYLFTADTAGNVTRSSPAYLAAAQYSPATATIYNEGYVYSLIGLGKETPTTSGGMVSAKIVPNIDVYWYNSTSTEKCSKYKSFTLPITGAPSSAIAFSFGNIALFIVGYRGGSIKNKGYLVRVSPTGVDYASMEFNFKREEMQGGVIGNDVAYIAGGYKNGQTTGDVEVIQLMRNMPIYPGMTYKLNNMSAEQTANSFTLHPLQNVTKLSGYMKI